MNNQYLLLVSVLTLGVLITLNVLNHMYISNDNGYESMIDNHIVNATMNEFQLGPHLVRLHIHDANETHGLLSLETFLNGVPIGTHYTYRFNYTMDHLGAMIPKEMTMYCSGHRCGEHVLFHPNGVMSENTTYLGDHRKYTTWDENGRWGMTCTILRDNTTMCTTNMSN